MKTNSCFSLWLSHCDTPQDAPRPPLCGEATGNTVWLGRSSHLGEQEDEGRQLQKVFLAAGVDTEINVDSKQEVAFQASESKKTCFWNAKKCFILVQKFLNHSCANFCSFHSYMPLFCVISVGNKSMVISISCSMGILCLCSNSSIVK